MTPFSDHLPSGILTYHSSRAFITRPNKALTEAIRIKKLSARQLVRANATRWSSFYDSLKSILELREAIELMIALDKERAKKRKKDGVFRADQLKDVSMRRSVCSCCLCALV